jgi:LCP family protein required for cell wall assembly
VSLPHEPTGPAPKSSRPRWQRAAMAVTVTFALLLGLLGAGGYLVYRHLNSNITVDASANDQLRTNQPTPTGSANTLSDAALAPMNILLMGSDTRVGQGGEGGSAKVYSSAQSDVVMLIHLYQGHRRALVMSIPRDTWVHMPTCKSKAGDIVGGYDTKFNAAFAVAGPACTIKQVKEVTGLPIDHFIVVDFNGVKDIINALGGVQFCLKAPMHDPIQNGHGSGLDLPAGHQVVMGEQGLAFLRARYSVGDGSDISRLTRQHAFLGAMVKQLQDAAVLTNLPRLYSILDAATKAITTDPGLGSLSKLKDLAQTLTGLKPANVTFLTIPWKPRGDGANVLIDQTQAQPLLTAIADDTPYPPVTSATVATGAPLKTAPADIHVKVVNASGVAGNGTKAAAALAAIGFQITSVVTGTSTLATTVVHYSPSYDQSGRTLTAAVTGATSVVDHSLGGTLVLYVGADYSGVQKVSVPTPLPSTEQVRTAAQSGCV